MSTSSSPRRLVVLTGSTRGIGAALAGLIAPSATLILPVRTVAADSSPPSLQLDLSAGEASGAAVAKAAAPFRPREIWFFDVAAVLRLEAVAGAGFAAALRTAMQVNVAAPMAIAAALLAHAREVEARFVGVHLTSGAANRPIARWGAYGMSKAAAALGWRTLAHEAPDAAVHIIDPGVVDTAMQQALRRAGDLAAAPVERLATPHLAAARILEQAGWRA